MEEATKGNVLYSKAATFIKKMHAVCGGKADYVAAVKDDINKHMYKMRQAIVRAYELEDPQKALNALGIARGKTGALYAMVDILTHTDQIPKGDCVELMTLINELKTELTVIMKEIKPDVDDWRKDFFAEFE